MRAVRNMSFLLFLGTFLAFGGQGAKASAALPSCDTGCFPRDGNYCDTGTNSAWYCDIVCPNYCNCSRPSFSYCYAGETYTCGCIAAE